MEVAVEAYRLLREEGLTVVETPLFKAPVKQDSDKYADLNMTQAIDDVLENFPGSTAVEIALELMRNGFKSDAKDLQVAVYTKLNKLTKRKRIVAKKEGKNRIRYRKTGEQVAPTTHSPVNLNPRTFVDE